MPVLVSAELTSDDVRVVEVTTKLAEGDVANFLNFELLFESRRHSVWLWPGNACESP